MSRRDLPFNQRRGKRRIAMAAVALAVLLSACSATDDPADIASEAASDGATPAQDAAQATDGPPGGTATDEATSDVADTSGDDAGPGVDYDATAVLAYGNNGMSSADPVRQEAGCEHAGLYTIFDTLFKRNVDGSISPRLATGWEMVDDTVVRITLRDDVIFQDGTPFNADAVAAHLDRSLNGEESTIASTLDFIQSVDVVDDLTVDITVDPPRVPLLLASLSYRAGMIASPTAFSEAGDSDAFSAHPVGAGPYAIEGEWFANERLSVRAWEGYWDAEHRYLGGIDLLQISTDQRFAALQAADLDLAFIEDGSVAAAATASGVTLVQDSTGEVPGILMNESLAPFDDVLVRRALQHATDREAIALAATAGVSQPAYQYFDPASPAYDPDLDDLYPHDPDRARELLAEAGYPDGLTFELAYPDSAPTYALFGELWAGQIADSGFTVTLNPIDRATSAANLFTGGPEGRGALPVYTYGFAAPIDPEVSFRTALLDDGFQNAGGHETPGLREAVDAASVESDPAARAGLLQTASRIALEDAAGVITLWYQSGNTAFTDRVGGVERGGTNCTTTFDGLYITG